MNKNENKNENENREANKMNVTATCARRNVESIAFKAQLLQKRSTTESSIQRANVKNNNKKRCKKFPCASISYFFGRISFFSLENFFCRILSLCLAVVRRHLNFPASHYVALSSISLSYFSALFFCCLHNAFSSSLRYLCFFFSRVVSQ